MQITGIICEYNPFHLGHRKQIREIRQICGEEQGVVCLMSGDYVQRGAPAIFDKSVRAKAAVLGGADLVLELPVQVALSSAEGFAAGGVKILSGFCESLCFGAETGNGDSLLETARGLLSEEFSGFLQAELERGISFPAARQKAAETMGLDGSLLASPNDILGVEYCKAILSQNSRMRPLVIRREGGYHAQNPDGENPSATSIRKQISEGAGWSEYIPGPVWPAYEKAVPHSLAAGERAVLARLRTMTEDAFAEIPFGGEGLWRKLMHACRECTTLQEILESTKSKRYTRSRLDRMVMCAFLGITQERMNRKPDYVRVLAFNDRGREILKNARNTGTFVNAGERMEGPDWELECRAGDLYGLFSNEIPDPPGAEEKRRVFYHRETV